MIQDPLDVGQWRIVAAGEEGDSFGELLRNYRRMAELTQEELADRAGLSVRSISDLERGEAHVPRRDTINLIVRALDLDAADRAAIEGAVDRRRGPRGRPTDTVPQPGVASETTPEHVATNLPRQLTSFVGRQQELQELQQVLTTTPLLTLVGAGGVGKTRLALELASTQLAACTDGVWLVELAGVDDEQLVAASVARALDVVEHAGQSLEESLIGALRSRQLLLVLDNCEHLVGECARLVLSLLQRCPALHVLATSREPLGVAGEVTWVVAPLGLPQSATRDDLRASAAVQLFVERALVAQPELVVDDQSEPVLAGICRTLDGLPLALELAAARLRAMSVYELAERLDTNPLLLSSRSRLGPSHHHTLRATLQWSLDLLDVQERDLFRRLGVFVGGWSLSLAELVCADGPEAEVESAEILDLLARLVDKSLVVRSGQAGVSRFRMLEPIRQYAQELLRSSVEADTYRARHAAALVDLAEQGEAQLSGPLEIASLDGLELEHANYRAALGWLIARRDGSGALRLATALWRFWERRGYHHEGCAWLEQALALPTGVDVPLEARGRALNALANMYWTTGDVDRATPLAEEALRASLHSPRGIAWAFINLGMIAYYQSDAERAVGCLEQSLPPARVAGDVPLLSLALSSLGRVLLWVRGPTEPRVAACLEESFAAAQQARSRHAESQALGGLAELAARRGDLDLAQRRWREALALRWELRDERGIATSLERLAQVAVGLGDMHRAAWLWGAAEARREALGLRFRHDEESDHARHMASATVEATEAEFASRWSAGASAALEHVVAYALTP